VRPDPTVGGAPARLADRGAWWALVVLGLVLVVLAAAWVPWSTPGLHGAAVHPTPAADFGAAALARDERFHAALRPWTYPRVAIVLVVTLVLGLTPLGARLVRRCGRLLGGSWSVTVVAGVVVLTVISTLVALPLSVGAELVLRRYGLSTQEWGGWTVDLLRNLAVSAAVTSLVLLALQAMARRWPRGWWAPASAAAALLVVVGSLLYPVLIEPLANDFRSMPAGPQRTALLDLARRDGQPVRDVLVADASKRTTTENAYVSGFGATRRLVVYDTLLRKATPREVEVVVAHELGHVANHDVRTGTTLGAVGAAWAVVLLALLARGRWWRRRSGIDGDGGDGVGDPRAVAALLAAFALGSILSAPVSNVVSRRIEARADVHALVLTRDAPAVADMQRQLATSDLSDLQPRWYRELLFETHPSPPWRVAMARSWAQQRGLPEPGG